ncbi:MAG: FtsX-like permease family protein [Candidatus Coproplasma sp.]
MRKTQWIALFRDIGKTFVSFISIAVFVALGVAIFLGIRWNEIALAEKTDSYLGEHNYHDFQLAFAYGFTDDDLQTITATDGITDAEGAYSAYGTTDFSGEKYVLSVQSLTERIDVSVALEGVMPSAPDEIGIERMFADAVGLKVGDKFTLDTDRSGTSYLKVTEFTVTAIVEHPSYFRNENDYSRGFCSIADSSVDYYVLASKDAFNTDAYGGCFSQIIIRCNSLDGLNTFSDDYAQQSAAIAEKISATGAVRAEMRYDSITSEADEKLAEAENSFREKRSELVAKYDEATALYSQLEKIDGLLLRYNQASDDENKQALVDGVVELIKNNPDKVAQIKPGIEELENRLDAYLEDPDSLTSEERETIDGLLEKFGLEINAESVQQLKGKLAIAKAFVTYYETDPDGAVESLGGTLTMLLAFVPAPDLVSAEEQLSEKLADALSDIDRLKSAIAIINGALGEDTGVAASVYGVSTQSEDGELAELEEAAKEYTDAKEKRQSLVRYENWTVQKRTDNPSVTTAKFYAQSSKKLCFSMSLLFVFVGLMVCYTSVSRNVNESKLTTGVQKALGFRSGEIAAHYLIYSALAVIIGCVFGFLLGFGVIETVVNNAYGRLFCFGTVANVCTLPETLLISLAELVLISIAAYLPCRKLLKRQAVELMRNDSSSQGREKFYWKFKFWNKLSLYTQTTINNLTGDGSRVIATLVGIAGCTALIVMSLSLRFAVIDTPVQHFNNVWVYDSYLVCDDSVSQADGNLRVVLDEENCDYVAIKRNIVYIIDENGAYNKADIIVPETTENLSDFIKLNDARTKNALSLPENGVIISRTYEKYHDIKIGDTVTVMDTSGVYREFVVAGVSEHYLSTVQLTMSRSYYEQVTGETYESNAFYVNYGEADAGVLQERLRGTEGYFSLADERSDWSAKFIDIASATMMVIYIGLFLSAAMALLVLLNLNLVCVQEKKNELIIMRINGFSSGEVKRYLYRDNIFLTVLGIVLGVFAGIGFSQWMLTILQKSGDNFYTTPNPWVCLAAAGLAALFSLITNLIALRKVDKLNVYDLKS